MNKKEKEIAILLQGYDRKHLANLLKQKKVLDQIYTELSAEAARIGVASGFDDPDKPFNLEDFPATKKRIDELIASFTGQLTTTIQEGSKREWLLSAEKNRKMVSRLAKGTGIPEETIEGWSQPNLDALEAFQQRKTKGMGLSERVWNLGELTRSQLELALDIGLGEGKSAAELSRDVRQYLNEPHKLFRRVRDKHGVLRLSKNAQAYHPGQGVYRSSYKNALRMTATENNMAYRTADHDKWGELDFVIGIEISLSNNHTLNGKPFKDICDKMVGRYPKTFKFTGWHPFCRCFATPILADWKEQLEVMKMQKEGKDVSNYRYKGEVKDMPEGYNKWIEDNKDRMASAKSVPIFIKDNYTDGKVENGLAWLKTTKLSIQERAAIRHAQRTPEKEAELQKEWNKRRIHNEGESYFIDFIDDYIKNYGVESTYLDAYLSKPLVYDEKNYTFTGLEELFEKYKAEADANITRSVQKRGELYRIYLEANNRNGLKAKKFAEKIKRHIDAIDKRKDSVAYWLSEKEQKQIDTARAKVQSIVAHRSDVLKAWRERQAKNATSPGDVSAKMPIQLKAGSTYLEGENYVFAKEFFDMLKATPTFEFVEGEGGGYESQNGHLVHIEGKTRLHRSRVQRIKLIYHEVGHAIADQRGLFDDPELKAMREKQIKLLRKKPKAHKWEKELSYENGKWVWKNVQVKVKSQADYLSSRLNALYDKINGMSDEVLKRHGLNKYDILENINATADTLKSLVTSYGWGHSNDYFSSEYLRHHEYLAHAFENTFNGNPVFKKLMPEIYEETIAYIRQVQQEGRDLRPTWK